MEKKKPVFVCGYPIWYHHHGHKIKVDKKIKGWISLKGSAASLDIQKAINRFPSLEYLKGQWLADWTVVQFGPTEEMVKGRRVFTVADLQNAFGLDEGSGPSGESLIKLYGADVAEQMKYIRWKEFLNIPCPGTGNDGDPNISILITQEIQAAATELIAQK